MIAEKYQFFKGDHSISKDNKLKNLDKAFKAPPWRQKKNKDKEDKKNNYIVPNGAADMINAAILLRRPLLITGDPGVGKSSLAHAVALELGLGEVLHWHINSKSTVESGLYTYDAIARLQDAQTNDEKTKDAAKDVTKYIKLGALGEAFASKQKRLLLIDEIDKSDIDLPNDLLQLFEDNYFEIDILKRLGDEDVTLAEGVKATKGRVDVETMPVVIMTSNNERDFPAAFMRRCLHYEMPTPDQAMLMDIVKQYLQDLDDDQQEDIEKIIEQFVENRKNDQLATDQLLNAVYLRLKGSDGSNTILDWTPLG
jgi:MoxR-like ATPase